MPSFRYILKRVFYGIPTIFGVLAMVFFLTRLLPGDPVDVLMGSESSLIDPEILRRNWSLDQNLAFQFFSFIGNFIKGDWGVSLFYGREVRELLLERFPHTLALTFVSLALSFCFSVGLAILSGCFYQRPLDRFLNFSNILLSAFPVFVLGPILLYGITLFFSSWALFENNLMSVFIPAFCLSVVLTPYQYRLLRASIVELLREDFVVVALAKGVGRFTVVWKHILKNALLPFALTFSSRIGALLAGSVITETVFDWPGIGDLFYTAFRSRDFPLIQGVVLWVTLTYVAVYIFFDCLHAWIDPRVSFDE